MCVGFVCLMHILKLQFLFSGESWFCGGVGGQICVDFKCLRHI